MKDTSQTIAETYSKLLSETLSRVETIAEDLKRAAMNTSMNWGHIGSLNHLNTLLDEVERMSRNLSS